MARSTVHVSGATAFVGEAGGLSKLPAGASAHVQGSKRTDGSTPSASRSCRRTP